MTRKLRIALDNLDLILLYKNEKWLLVFNNVFYINVYVKNIAFKS